MCSFERLFQSIQYDKTRCTRDDFSFSRKMVPLFLEGSGRVCYARRINFLSENCNILSVLSMFKYKRKAKQTINLLRLNNFYPVISYTTSSIEKESDELLYTVRSLVTVRNQLPAQVVKDFCSNKERMPAVVTFCTLNNYRSINSESIRN